VDLTIVVVNPSFPLPPARERCRFVVNPDHQEGMGSSLRVAVGAAPENADAYLIALADMPGIKSVHPFGEMLHVVFDTRVTDIAAVKRRLEEARIVFQSLKRIKPSFEDAFLALAQEHSQPLASEIEQSNRSSAAIKADAP
jgi:hypothetical protein